MDISVLAELERIGWAFDPVGDDEVKVKCPFHDDQHASASINIQTGMYCCHAAGCSANGGHDFVTFVAKVFGQPRHVVFAELTQRYNLDTSTKPVEIKVVEDCHQDIWTAKTLLSELYKRGLDDEAIRKYRLGYKKGRITIPVFNEAGICTNIRFYLPGAPGADKMKNMRGHGKIRLYPIEQLKYDAIVICGGEIKAIAVAMRMNRYGIGAIAATSGEGNWDNKFNVLFRGKRVYVCMDIDEAGQAASDKICARIKPHSSWIGRLNLPLDVDKYAHGDVNDYFGCEGKTAEEFKVLIEAVKEWKPQSLPQVEESAAIELGHLSEAVHAGNTGRRIGVKAMVSAIDTAPYIIPRDVYCMCDRSQDSCHLCPVYAQEAPKGYVKLSVPMESPAILEMVSAPKKSLRDSIREGLGIPTCKVVDFKAETFYNIEDVRLSPQLEISSRAVDHLMQPALCVGQGLQANESYNFTGRMYPHPKNQQSVLLISDYTPTQDALSTYRPSESELEELHLFQPEEWTVESLDRRLDEIYADFEANVTRIFRRRELHVSIDLAYHSVLLVPFDGRTVKGWAEVLIAGDSSQGKSEASTRIMEHYGLGERVECKNSSVAGLLGGLQKEGNRWFVSWGVIPTHDKRLVILEELKGAPVEVIGHLTDMRSSGIAELPKIEKRRTHARTRLIAISNPRSDRPVSSFNFGVEVFKELIGGLEDIRRFDLAVLLSEQQVSGDELNKLLRNRPQIKHRFTHEVCRRLVLWGWTRTPGDIQFTPEAQEAALDLSASLCSRYSEMIPLCDRGSMRYKLARLASALAVRTFSCGKDNTSVLVVRPCHVEWVSQFIDGLYTDPTFGYRDFSYATTVTSQLIKPDEVKLKVMQTPFPRDFIDSMLHTNEIELRDICDWCGWEKSDALVLLSFLVRRHALIRRDRGYHKNPAFISLLKDILASPELSKFERPEFISEEKF